MQSKSEKVYPFPFISQYIKVYLIFYFFCFLQSPFSPIFSSVSNMVSEQIFDLLHLLFFFSSIFSSNVFLVLLSYGEQLRDRITSLSNLPASIIIDMDFNNPLYPHPSTLQE